MRMASQIPQCHVTCFTAELKGVEPNTSLLSEKGVCPNTSVDVTGGGRGLETPGL